MSYAHIKNLYNNTEIMMFKRIFALEKIHGCLRKGSKILMADGTEKNIENIQSGDEVITYDKGKQSFIESIVLQQLVQETDTRLGWMSVELENGKTITCTVDHPFLTTNRGWVRADELCFTDNLVEYS